MTHYNLARRTVLSGLRLIALTGWAGLAKAAMAPAIIAYRNPGCGCCEKWAQQLKAAGFEVDMQDDADLSARRSAARVPDELAGCHTALMGDYVIEGHVPLADVQRLLAEKPDVRGIAVPGMPIGSPAWKQRAWSEAFQVWAFKSNGARFVFAEHGPE